MLKKITLFTILLALPYIGMAGTEKSKPKINSKLKTALIIAGSAIGITLLVFVGYKATPRYNYKEFTELSTIYHDLSQRQATSGSIEKKPLQEVYDYQIIDVLSWMYHQYRTEYDAFEQKIVTEVAPQLSEKITTLSALNHWHLQHSGDLGIIAQSLNSFIHNNQNKHLESDYYYRWEDFYINAIQQFGDNKAKWNLRKIVLFPQKTTHIPGTPIS